MIPNPYFLLALALAWAASCGLAYYKGGEHRENAIAAQAARTAQDRQAAADAAAAQLEERKRQRRDRDRWLDQEVDAYAATDAARADCFDAAGLLLFNGGTPAAVPVPGGGHGGVPSGPAAGEGR